MDNKERVYSVLEKDWMGIIQIAAKAGLSRITASKYLWLLEANGKAEVRRFGTTQAFRVKEAEG